MKITYLGPSQAVIVHPFGEHRKNETKEYPDSFGEELIATSRKQQFSICADDADTLAADHEITDDAAEPEAAPATAKKPAPSKQPGKSKPGPKKRIQ